MKTRFAVHGLIACCVAALVPIHTAHAQAPGDSALLDALVKKGVLSDQEAEDIRAEDDKAWATTSASKITLSSSIKNITFYGDIRLRFEMRDGEQPTNTVSNNGTIFKHADTQTMNRWRYRLRFGVKGELYDNFFFGIRLATNPNYDRSGNVSFGHSDAAGPFGKDQSLLSVDQVYLGWHATSDITLIGGQMPNPLYTTNLVWDDNLNPAGAAEEWDHTFDQTEVFATAGQFVYQEAAGNGIWNGINATGGSNFSDTFMFAEQVGFKQKFDDNTFFKAAATVYTYSGTKGNNITSVAGLYSTNPLNLAAPNSSPSFFNGPFVGAADAPTTNVSGINNLAILETPMEFDFKVCNIPMRFFGDFAYNFQANERADAARGAIETLAATNTSNVGVTSAGSAAANKAMIASNNFQGVLTSGKNFLDQSAYQVGYEIGQLKKKGDWDGKLYYQSTGYYAVDPNLIDADMFNAAVNMQGVVVAVSHNWTDGVSSTLRYGYATQVNDKMATPNVNQDLQVGTISHYNLFQADLMWKF